MGEGGGVCVFKLPRYVPPHRVGFLRRFGVKSGMVFEGTTRVYNVFIVSIPNEKKEREICEFKMDLKNFFVCALI